MKNGIIFPAERTYHLLRSTLVFPNPECLPLTGVNWYRKVEIYKFGVFDIAGWSGWRGGGWCTFTDFQILDERTLTEDEDTYDLDLTRTSTYADLMRKCEEQRLSLGTTQKDLSGFLSPDAVFHPCGYHMHDVYAEYVLKNSASSLNRKGWARLDRYGTCQQDLNPEQRRWLENVNPERYLSRIS